MSSNAIQRWIKTIAVPSHIRLAPIEPGPPPPEGFWEPGPMPLSAPDYPVKPRPRKKRDYKGEARRRREREREEEEQREQNQLSRLKDLDEWGRGGQVGGRACPEWLTPPPEEDELQIERLALGLECSMAVMGKNGRKRQGTRPPWKLMRDNGS